MDKETLLKALDNEKNENILNFTTKKIKEIKLKIITELKLEQKDMLHCIKKLEGYRYVDELDELKYGAFIKWIPIINSDQLPLHAGGIICDIKITNNGVSIVCKNFKGRYFQFKMSDHLIFQKLTYQEQILLMAIDHLS
jgi:hypothetical protein